MAQATTQSADALAAVQRFNDAFARGDVDAVMEAMTDDCVFENTSPAPDGERYVGRAAVRTFWGDFFAGTENPRFETEEMFAAGDHVVVRWRFTWGAAPGEGHVRGVDIFRLRDGKVAEKLSYVKG
jgi:ketosteroid isomerase-like protein